MVSRHRSDPLALAILICLNERPMYPYEAAVTLRQRNKHESARLNLGSLYRVFASLEQGGLVVAVGVSQEGRNPERTTYELTEAGRAKIHDWLTDLARTPVNEHSRFEAALAFLPVLPPDDAVALLEERASRLEVELVQTHAAREEAQMLRLPRLFWLEGEFRTVMLVAEIGYVRGLARDIVSGTFAAVEWWRHAHDHGLAGLPLADGYLSDNFAAGDSGTVSDAG